MAAITAARLRFRPILMTAVSFILGTIPLVIASGAGARSRVSLGSTVFGGMILYTALGVFFIPFLYVIVEQIAGGRKGKGEDGSPDPVPTPPDTPVTDAPTGAPA